MSSFYRPSTLRAPRPRRRESARSAALALALLLGTGSALAALILTLRHHPRFVVTRVVLEGVPEMRRSEAEALTDPWIGKPLLFVDIDGPVAALSGRPWVAQAAARRIVPDAIVVQVTARPAVAVARRGGELWAVDRSGTWLGPYAGKALGRGDAFVVIDPGPADELVAASRAVAGATAFLDRLKEDDPALLARVSEVEVRRDGLAVVDKEARVKLLFGADAAEPGRAVPAWRAYLALRPELERHALLRPEVDLRFADRIVLVAPASEAGRGKT